MSLKFAVIDIWCNSQKFEIQKGLPIPTATGVKDIINNGISTNIITTNIKDMENLQIPGTLLFE